MITQQQYDTNWQAYQRGMMSMQQWVQFCDVVLVQCLQQNKSVFIRLKYR